MNNKTYKLPNGKIAAFEYDIFGIGKITLECMDELMDMIADRPQGEWIDEADKYDASFGIHDYRCSNCNSYADEYIGGHEWYTAGKPNFCPYCGADMRERKESE